MSEENQPTPAESTPLERGKVYASEGPNGEEIAIMTFETWTDFGTSLESMRQALANQSRLLGEARTDHAVALRRLADVQTRLDNLRAVRRAEKRSEVEKMFELTPEENKVQDHVRDTIAKAAP